VGREVKRVPLDFDHPLNERWTGYVMPDKFDESPCPQGPMCMSGSTPARAWVGQLAHMLLMLDDDRRAQHRGRPMHPYFDSVPRPTTTHEDFFDRMRNPRPVVPRPSEDIAEFGTGLAGREGGWLGHDAIDRWNATDALIKAAGLDPEVWGICQACGGHGSVETYPGQRDEAEEWQREEPPEGEGWQLWETVSEGSPISPVFPTAQELARWLATWEGAHANNQDQPMPYEAALAFVMEGHSFTLYTNPGGVHEGSEFVGTQAVLDTYDTEGT